MKDRLREERNKYTHSKDEYPHEYRGIIQLDQTRTMKQTIHIPLGLRIRRDTLRGRVEIRNIDEPPQIHIQNYTHLGRVAIGTPTYMNTNILKTSRRNRERV